jgi:hypothetical protein
MNLEDFQERLWVIQNPEQRDRIALSMALDEGALVPVEYDAVALEWPGVSARLYVARDYLQVGTPEDCVRWPFSAPSAQLILDKIGAVFPTKKMVDLIWKSEGVVRVEPSPLGFPYDASMSSVSRIVAHDSMIIRQLQDIGGDWGSKIIAGQKKDVVNTPRRKPGNVAIYGWHKLDGSVIQQLNYASHSLPYYDYSHGIRAIRMTMAIGDDEVSVMDVLRDPHICGMLSDEGVLTDSGYTPAHV